MMTPKTTRIEEQIQVCDKRFNYFPKTFRWRGETYHVRSVDRCWTVTRRRLLGSVERHCFRVRTAGGVYDLHQDLDRNEWYLARVVAQGV